MGIFNVNQRRNLEKNKFDLSHEVKMSGKMGILYPVLNQEVLPGDSFRCNTEIMARFAPLLAPIMHRVDIWTHSFYVPYRLLWDKWEDFIRETDIVSPEIPQLKYDDSTKGQFVNGTLADYLGFPVASTAAPTVTGEQRLTSFDFKAYQLIWNEWFRDQETMTEIDIRKSVDGLDTSSNLTTLRLRSWQKDYFTTAKPRAQKGEPVSFLELNEDILVKRKSDDSLTTAVTSVHSSATGRLIRSNDSVEIYIDQYKGEIADLRRAEAVQKYLERAQRSGNRYKEYLSSNWGINYASIDSRIDIPEFLGGSKSPMVISEVLATADAGDNEVGSYAGHGVGVGSNHGFRASFPEHGVVMTLLSITPKPAYQDGLHRKWFRTNKFDFYTPDLANIGEQEIFNKELYFDLVNPADTVNQDAFGYQQRYAEYKYMSDRVAGDFRFSLFYWHLSRKFQIRPTLSQDFLQIDQDNESLTRIFNVTDQSLDNIWIQIYHKIDAIRPMYYESIPAI